eukprot:scaffold304091_cov33-Tisochrysis_lutea.AAC.2
MGRRLTNEQWVYRSCTLVQWRLRTLTHVQSADVSMAPEDMGRVDAGMLCNLEHIVSKLMSRQHRRPARAHAEMAERDRHVELRATHCREAGAGRLPMCKS